VTIKLNYLSKLVTLLLIIAPTVFWQDITNTIAPSGKFIVKDASNNYLTLEQSTGQMNILRTLRLENTSSSTLGVIYKGTDRFIHDYYPATSNNTFMGIKAGNFTLTTSNYNTGIGHSSLFSLTTGGSNTALGYVSLYSNTTGHNNSAVGFFSLSSNTTGYLNSAFGTYSLSSNTTGLSNTAFGAEALRFNTTGNGSSAFGASSLSLNTTGLSNSAFGYNSLSSNTTGNYNSALGYQSLTSNITGSNNSAFGYLSLYSNTGQIGLDFGNRNSAFGERSLFANTTGNNNTAIGYEAGYNNRYGSNNIAIGYNSVIPFPDGNNQVVIGNSFITYAGVHIAWTITSDRRWKEDIQPLNLGLGFISKLNPVSYIRKNDEKRRTEYGFIAQEIEEVLQENGVNTSGMLTIDEKGYYELRYNDLFAPMVKALQELSKGLQREKEEKDFEIAKLESANEELKKEVAALQSMSEKLAALEQMVNVQTSIKQTALVTKK